MLCFALNDCFNTLNVCYAKGKFLQLNFLANNMCNIGAVIAQLVTV